jgi:hypothetical protein
MQAQGGTQPNMHAKCRDPHEGWSNDAAHDPLLATEQPLILGSAQSNG